MQMLYNNTMATPDNTPDHIDHQLARELAEINEDSFRALRQHDELLVDCFIAENRAGSRIQKILDYLDGGHDLYVLNEYKVTSAGFRAFNLGRVGLFTTVHNPPRDRGDFTNPSDQSTEHLTGHAFITKHGTVYHAPERSVGFALPKRRGNIPPDLSNAPIGIVNPRKYDTIRSVPDNLQQPLGKAILTLLESTRNR